MIKNTLVVSVLMGSLLFSIGSAFAADEVMTQEQVQVKDKVQKKEQIYGSQMMTSEERVEQRNKMRSAKTAEERERIRAEHHETMKIRAQERGVTLPDTQPEGGMGSGAGMGAGPSGGSRQNRGK
jgi:hypothetical protein